MKLRRAIEIIVGFAAESRLLRPVVMRSAFRSINVIYYHHVGSPAPHYKAFYNGCTTSQFADSLRRLNRLFDFVPLSEVLASPSPTENRDRPILAVTFDDGFDLRASGAMEALDRYGVKATTFVITSCVGNQAMMWRHKLSAIQALAPTDVCLLEYNKLALSLGLKPIRSTSNLLFATKEWDMNRKDEWAAELWHRCRLPKIETYLSETRPYFDLDGLHAWISGGHSVGFHSHTHPYCSRLGPSDLGRELIQPSMQLRQSLGLTELPFSYPFGDRLRPELERELFEKRVFNSFFGIRGFSRKKRAAGAILERASVEGVCIGWAVFAPHAFGFSSRIST